MAITSEYIGGDNEKLREFLEDSGFFGSVLYDSGTDTVTMKDNDNNILATFGDNTFTAYVDATHSASRKFVNSTGYGIHTAYKCGNGILLKFSGFSAGYLGYQTHILITPTNNNKLCFVFSNSNAQGTYTDYINFYIVAWGDSVDITARTMGYNNNAQTLMIPFLTNANVGNTSYTPDAFYLLYAQYYSMGYGIITLNNTNYLTNGYWAIRDGN